MPALKGRPGVRATPLGLRYRGARLSVCFTYGYSRYPASRESGREDSEYGCRPLFPQPVKPGATPEIRTAPKTIPI